ncbi:MULTISPECIES: hypothetical protein [unclassified Micromonospora]|uniref:hypothetical protein n=1 Tax=unclassified Micromonospora TaxID=2617518 RepID=UPI002FF158D1
MTGEEMAVVTVRRGEDLGGLLRKMKIEVDGDVVAKLEQGSSIDLNMQPGRHVFRAKLDWQASAALEIYVTAESKIVLEISSGEYAQTFDGAFRRPDASLEIFQVSPTQES